MSAHLGEDYKPLEKGEVWQSLKADIHTIIRWYAQQGYGPMDGLMAHIDAILDKYGE